MSEECHFPPIEPCPYCKAKEVYLSHDASEGDVCGYISWVSCSNCGSAGPALDTPEAAITAWNAFLCPNNINIQQPMPHAGGETIILPLVIQDLKVRAEFGKEHYGTYLKTFNGRDALVDAYQEALDLIMYLKQELMERDKQHVGKGV